MKYVVGVCGTPGAGKSTFCKCLQKHLNELKRPVKLYNLDAGSEVMLGYKPDWNITNTVRVSEVMRQAGLGPNGALMEAMSTFLENQSHIVLSEMDKCENGSFIILDLPGQVELYTVRDTIKNFYEKLVRRGYAVCSVFMFDSSVLLTPDFFIAYSTNVIMSMLRIGQPAVNIVSKIDVIYNAKNSGKLEFPFEYYAAADCVTPSMSLGKECGEDVPIPGSRKTYRMLTEQLAEVNESYGLLNYLPFTACDERFVEYVRFEIDRAVGYVKSGKDQVEMVTVASSRENELNDFLETFLEKCVKRSKRK